MGNHRLLKVSLLFNAALLAAAAASFYLLEQRPNAVSATPRQIESLPTNQTPPSPSATAADPLNAVKTNFPAGFDWSQIADYKTYIANLRAINCPQQTICDIITADVNALYQSRKAALRPADADDFKFWQTTEHHRLRRPEADEISHEEAALDAEKQAVLQELLGGACQQTQSISSSQTNWDARLAFLSPEVRAQARAIEDRYPGLNDEIKDVVDKGSTTNQPADIMQSLQLYAQRKAELIQLLGTNNYELYDMATSWSGDNVRRGLMGFNPTEDEFRAIFDVWRAQDEGLATIYATGQPDPGVQAVNDAIHQALGDDRFAQYARAWGNNDYHSDAELAYDYGLPSDLPDQLFDLRQQTEAQQQQLLSDPSLNDAQRTAALQALQAQTIQSMTQQLGPAAYQTYIQSTGNWIQNLAPGANH
jgi:hypothetical protein